MATLRTMHKRRKRAQARAARGDSTRPVPVACFQTARFLRQFALGAAETSAVLDRFAKGVADAIQAMSRLALEDIYGQGRLPKYLQMNVENDQQKMSISYAYPVVKKVIAE